MTTLYVAAFVSRRLAIPKMAGTERRNGEKIDQYQFWARGQAQRKQSLRTLSSSDVDRTSGHEPSDGRDGDELDEPADSKEADAEDNETAEWRVW
jgi:hypothetical protein